MCARMYVQSEAVARCFPLASLASLSNVQRWSKALSTSWPLVAILQELAVRLIQNFYVTLRTLVWACYACACVNMHACPRARVCVCVCVCACVCVRVCTRARVCCLCDCSCESAWCSDCLHHTHSLQSASMACSMAEHVLHTLLRTMFLCVERPQASAHMLMEGRVLPSGISICYISRDSVGLAQRSCLHHTGASFTHATVPIYSIQHSAVDWCECLAQISYFS